MSNPLLTLTLNSFKIVCDTLNGEGHRVDYCFDPESPTDIELYHVLNPDQQQVGEILVDKFKSEIRVRLPKELTDLLLN